MLDLHCMWSFPAHGLGPHSAADVQVFQIFQVSSSLHQSLSGMEWYSECMLASASLITIFMANVHMYRYIIIATFLVLLYIYPYITWKCSMHDITVCVI